LRQWRKVVPLQYSLKKVMSDESRVTSKKLPLHDARGVLLLLLPQRSCQPSTVSFWAVGCWQKRREIRQFRQIHFT